MPTLYHLEIPGACAAVIATTQGRIIEAAPLLSWSLGRPIETLLSWAERRGSWCIADTWL